MNVWVRRPRFTLKVILLAVAPLVFLSAVLVMLWMRQTEALSHSATALTEAGLEEVYRSHLSSRSADVTQKVALKRVAVRSELNIIRGAAQTLIDQPELAALGEAMQAIPLLRNEFAYDADGNWSNLRNNATDVSMSVWGCLHDQTGRIDALTQTYTTRMAAMKPLLYAVGRFGMEKGWLYVTGPKAMPVMVMTPWAQMPASFDEKYPGHNSEN